MILIQISLVLISATIWIGLLSLRGFFWLNQPILERESSGSKNLDLREYPPICAVIPARNEATLIADTLRSHFQQNYPGRFSVVLVDDGSEDDTAAIAEKVAGELNRTQDLQIISGQALPLGWTGKLWALSQGIAATTSSQPKYIFLTDADILHHRDNLQHLVNQAENQHLDLVSVMVKLRCQSFWERLLIPAFVFFFKKLYPFRWVNNPDKSMAGAAGGCILIRSTYLNQIGGISRIRQALIDDCTLAQVVKSQGGKIWLGLSSLTVSLRPYPNLSSIWQMVARTAFCQLNYSWLLLIATVIGMAFIYLVAPVVLMSSIISHSWLFFAAGMGIYLFMAIAYFPTIRFYGLSPWLSLSLPIVAVFYTLMTIDSALQHWQGKGGSWKDRVYKIG